MNSINGSSVMLFACCLLCSLCAMLMLSRRPWEGGGDFFFGFTLDVNFIIFCTVCDLPLIFWNWTTWAGLSKEYFFFFFAEHNRPYNFWSAFLSSVQLFILKLFILALISKTNLFWFSLMQELLHYYTKFTQKVWLSITLKTSTTRWDVGNLPR